MQDVVCNASPLIFLAKIKRLNLLDTCVLHIPCQVESEIRKGFKRKKEDAKLLINYLKQHRYISTKVAILKDMPDFLGDGEKAVISLAIRDKIEKVFIDEAKARTVAKLKGLYPKGTLGILWDSYKMGNIDGTTLEALSFELLEKGYRIKEEVFIEFLKKLKGADS